MRRVLVPCVLLLAIVLPPNAASAGGHHVSWWREFGTPLYDWASDVVVTDHGTFVTGGTQGAFPGFEAPTEYGAESTAAFVRAYRSDGSLWWTREFSPSDYDWASSIAADSTGVYVGGSTVGAFPNKKDKGRNDAFVRKFSFAGDVLWTRQFGSNQDDLVSGVAVADGRFFVVGETHGRLPGQTHFSGDYDAFIKVFTSDGRRRWTEEFGSDSSDGAAGVAVDASGVYVAGSTYGTLPGQHRRGEDDVFVRRYGTDGKEVWTRQFGSRDEDDTSGVAAGPRGVYVIGTTYGSFKGETNAGRSDAFVAALAPDGSKLWKEEFGTPLSDEASDADVEGSRIYVTGDGQQAVAGSRHANSEAFVRSYGLDGVERWEKRFGTDGHDSARAIDVVPGSEPAAPGGAYVLGTTTGAFPGQTRVGKADLFLVRIAA